MKYRIRTDAEKKAILAEGAKPGVVLSQVLRKHKISSSQFYGWRDKFANGEASQPAVKAASNRVFRPQSDTDYMVEAMQRAEVKAKELDVSPNRFVGDALYFALEHLG